MELLDGNKTYNVEVQSNIVLDFIEAMFLVAEKDILMKFGDEMDIEIDNEFTKIIEGMEKNVSRFMKQELDYFFDFNIGGIGYLGLASYSFHSPDLIDIGEAIYAIENSDIDSFISHITKFFVEDYDNEEEIKALYKARDYTKILDLIDKSEKDSLFKEKLMECIENPIETKHRFTLLLKQFYQKSYKLYEDKIREILTAQKELYEKLLFSNPRSFFTQYTKNNLDFYTSEKIFIYPSYSKYVGVSSILRKNKSVVVIGFKNSEHYGKKAIKERIHKFFKVLCDKKRLDIIDLLGERPHYVQELAEKLGLTSATISYHMNFLFGLDLVSLERSEHRIYYSLKKERAHEMFDEAIRLLLHE